MYQIDVSKSETRKEEGLEKGDTRKKMRKL